MKSIFAVVVTIILIGIVGILYLQNNADEYSETIFFTLQGDDAINSHPHENNWSAGEKMTYISTFENGLLVLATSSANDTVFAFNGETGESIDSFHVGKTPKGVKISPNGNFAFVANEGSDSVSVINLILGKIHTEIPVGKTPHNIIFNPSNDLGICDIAGGRIR